MIERLLIANRGEIARRIIGTCRRLGIVTIAVHSEADADAAFVTDADLAVNIGGLAPADSYLRTDLLLDAARRTGADAIHPGYGFLSENADFARSVVEAGMIFVGPTPDAIAAMGSKLEAKRRMSEAGVPLLPSAELTGLDPSAAASAAADVGFPLLIKASAGGGGRGMRIVEQPADLDDAVRGAVREAESAFGDGTVYAERYISPSRHVEVQIFGDAAGRVVHFHERECSIQRRHQKIIEEAPSPSLDHATREALHAAAVRAGEAIGYQNAGTVEFLLAPDGQFYFLEVNTRLQVEHPVTEAVLGIDLVELQLAVASGGPVPAQDDIGRPEGHAVEARLYAEDPTRDYLPSAGRVHAFMVSGEVRVDSGLDGAGTVPQFYDPMIAKVIAHGPDRAVACRRLASALAKSTVDGIATNLSLLVRTLRHPEFLGDRGDSDFLIRNDPADLGRPLVEGADLDGAAAAAALAVQAGNRAGDVLTPGVATGFRNVPTQPRRLGFDVGPVAVDGAVEPLTVDYSFVRGRLSRLAVDGRPVDAALHRVSADQVDLTVNGIRQRYAVTSVAADARTAPSSGRTGEVARLVVTGVAGSVTFGVRPSFPDTEGEVTEGSTVAAMPGKIVSVDVSVGDRVEPGDQLLVMEAMKMELSVTATSGGVVEELPVAPGDAVEAGAVLVVIDATT
jgi:acetyl/propionyl-CoA carboxylase alpha subunit